MSETNPKPAASAPKEYEFHRLATLFPDMPEAEYAVFAKDIAENGIRVPISLYKEVDGKQYIVDGKHRYKAAKASWRELTDKDFVELPVGTDLVKFVVSQNVNRRHLNESQRALIAAGIANLKNGANQHTKGGSIDLGSAAQMLNVSHKSVQRARNVLDNAAPDVVQQVQEGKVRVSAVTKKVLELPKDQQLKTLTAEKPTSLKPEQTEEEKAKAADAEKVNAELAVKDASDKAANAFFEAVKALHKVKPEEAEIDIAKLIQRLTDADLYNPSQIKKAA